MVKVEKRRSAQDNGSAQKGAEVQKEGERKGERTIHSRVIYLKKDIMCNQMPPTPARSISLDKHPIPSPLSSLSSNSWVVYYTNTTAMYGQAQCPIVRQEEEEIAPEDSASMRVSPTHRITNSLEVLAPVCNGTLTEEDVVMDHNKPQGFKEAL